MTWKEVLTVFLILLWIGIVSRSHSDEIKFQQQQIDSLKFLAVMQQRHILRVDSINVLILETLNDEIVKDNNNRDSLISYLQGKVFIISKYLGQEPEFK